MARGANRGLGIDFEFLSHDGLINNRGETVLHETGLRCPCGTEDVFAGYAEKGIHVPRKRLDIISCALCGGLGRIYRDPRKIVGLITNISETRNQSEFGWAQPGDCILAPHLRYQLSTGDKVTFTWSQPLDEGQTIVRGAAAMGSNAALSTGLAANEDRLLFHAEKSIWCEDENGVTYTVGDFIVDGSRIIKWVGNTPADGVKYTFKYLAYFEWIAFASPATRRDRDRDFGQRVVLRKLHVALGTESAAGSPFDKTPFCDRMTSCGIAT